MTTKKTRYGHKELEKEFGHLAFADLLVSHRLGEEYSQARMAGILGISRQNLCDYEKGRKIPSARKAAEIAEVLGFGVATFVQVALQDQLRRDGVDLVVDVNKPSKKKRA